MCTPRRRPCPATRWSLSPPSPLEAARPSSNRPGLGIQVGDSSRRCPPCAARAQAAPPPCAVGCCRAGGPPARVGPELVQPKQAAAAASRCNRSAWRLRPQSLPASAAYDVQTANASEAAQFISVSTLRRPAVRAAIHGGRRCATKRFACCAPGSTLPANRHAGFSKWAEQARCTRRQPTPATGAHSST